MHDNSQQILSEYILLIGETFPRVRNKYKNPEGKDLVT